MHSLQAVLSVSLSARPLRSTATLRWHAQVSHCLPVHAHGDAHFWAARYNTWLLIKIDAERRSLFFFFLFFLFFPHGDAHASISIPAITSTSMSRQSNIFKLCIALHTLSKAM